MPSEKENTSPNSFPARPRRKFLAALMTLVVPGAALAYQRGSRIYYVCPEGKDTNDGLTVRTAWRSIGYAVKTAGTRDQIFVHAGEYHEKPFILTRMPQSRDVV